MACGYFCRGTVGGALLSLYHDLYLHLVTFEVIFYSASQFILIGGRDVLPLRCSHLTSKFSGHSILTRLPSAYGCQPSLLMLGVSCHWTVLNMLIFYSRMISYCCLDGKQGGKSSAHTRSAFLKNICSSLLMDMSSFGLSAHFLLQSHL